MNALEIIRDIVENKKTGLLRVESYIFLFKEGKLLESAGKTSNREQAIMDVVENDYKNVEFQELDASVIISFNEPLDISDRLPKKRKGREIKLDENLSKKLFEIKSIISNLSSSLVGKIKGEILAFDGFNEDEIDSVADSVEAIYEKFPDLNEIILTSRKGATYIKFSDNKYIVCNLNTIENVGILKAIIGGMLK